jgi:hypothetical protein
MGKWFWVAGGWHHMDHDPEYGEWFLDGTLLPKYTGDDAPFSMPNAGISEPQVGTPVGSGG